ncbi:MAG TPA: SusD/RagB family nutrient-binding outer membrane lipoprotein [Flavobacterium sp.]|nr:SusD/RagB family nutrient-binding outer membrane lipoprotein [Flavobacterium sp.]
MKKVLSIVMLSMLFTACDTDLDINQDPDSLTDIPLASQLPAGELGLVAAEGSHYALIGGFWSQYWTQSTIASQYKDVDSYIIGTGDYYTAWRDMYDALGDIRQVKRKALAQENWKFYLMASVLDAQGSQILTDFYGSIPYTEANNIDILQPAFDSGESVYDSMITDLDFALSKDLSTSVGDAPGAEDLFFAGDMDQWTAFANTLKLKIFMRQTNSSRASIADAGITALLSSGVTFLDTDAGVTQFEDTPNLSNPLYETDRRKLNNAENLRKSKTLSSYLDANGDSRAAEYYRPGNALDQGDFNNLVSATTISVVELHPTTPAFLMSREESLFLQAEAQARYGSATDAKTAYDAAVIHNFSRYELDGSTYVAAGGAYEYPTGGSLQDQIKAIITQKWVAAFPGNGFEAFFDTNRTGYPATSAVPQANPGYVPGELAYSVNGATSGGLFPKRIVYPQEETNTNSSTPALLPITTPVWWAQN